jgi:uncharacterized protein (DUF1778 family)
MAGAGERTKRGRDARLAFRLDRETRSLIERAASVDGQRLTDYCLGVLAEAARRRITEHDAWVLAERDRRVFFDLLMNPPEPNARLREDFALAESLTGR